MSQDQRPGASTVVWEEPDTCVIRYIGKIDSDEMRRIVRESRVFLVGRPYVFGLIDLVRGESFSAEARKLSKEGADGVQSRGTAIFGASPALRVLSSIVIRAHDLLYKRDDNPVRFFSTETEARAWLLERRRLICEREI